MCKQGLPSKNNTKLLLFIFIIGFSATYQDQSLAKETAPWHCRTTSCRVRTVHMESGSEHQGARLRPHAYVSRLGGGGGTLLSGSLSSAEVKDLSCSILGFCFLEVVECCPVALDNESR